VVSSVSIFLFGILLFMVLISATHYFRERKKSKFVKVMIWASIVLVRQFACYFSNSKERLHSLNSLIIQFACCSRFIVVLTFCQVRRSFVWRSLILLLIHSVTELLVHSSVPGP
jgi:uncharacterized membrane protein HdeD (DUF308 family)